MSTESSLRDYLISTIEIVKEQQRALLHLFDRMASVDDFLDAASPGAKKALEHSAKMFGELSRPIDEGVTMQRFDDLIQRLRDDPSLNR